MIKRINMNNEDKIITEKAEYDATFAGAETASILADVAARPRPIPTGIVAVDRMLGGGFDYGKLYVLASAPAMGKTTLALQFAVSLSAQGTTCCMSRWSRVPVCLRGRT